MKKILSLLAMTALLASCEQQPAGEPVIRADLGKPDELVQPELMPGRAELEEVSASADSVCSEVSFEDVPLTHCIADPAVHVIRTDLALGRGQPYGSLTALAETVDPAGVAFALNAGAYGDDRRPIGYFVEDSERLSELDRSDGSGNFYLKPNGVFFGSDGSWQILTSDRFFSTIGDRPKFGTQSGPMLVIKGELHPEISNNGPSRAIRNGVGIDADGKAHFVKSEAPLSFGQLARFFRDELGTPNALFLDSNVSSLWDPATGRLDTRTNLGPLIVVENK